MEPQWTKETIRLHRPYVPVRVVPDKPHPEQIVEGRVVGDHDGFARIRIVWYGLHHEFQAAYDTVAHCLNNDRPIRY